MHISNFQAMIYTEFGTLKSIMPLGQSLQADFFPDFFHNQPHNINIPHETSELCWQCNI